MRYMCNIAINTQDNTPDFALFFYYFLPEANAPRDLPVEERIDPESLPHEGG